jgi:hypothetical protein
MCPVLRTPMLRTPMLRTPMLNVPLQSNFSRAAPHYQGLGSFRNGDRVSGRWFLMILNEILMKMTPEQTLW